MAEEEDTEAPAPKRSLVGKLGLVLLLLVLCLAGVAGGVMLALGPAATIALVTGAEPEADDEMAGDAEHEDGGHGDESGGHGEKTAASDYGSSGHGASDKGGHGKGGKQEMAITPFKEIIVNISATTTTGRQTSRFMKLNIALVYDDTLPGAERIDTRRLYLRDSFQDYLRQLTERDLQGSMGFVVVKTELLRRARTITESAAPQEMLISDLIVQ